MESVGCVHVVARRPAVLTSEQSARVGPLFPSQPPRRAPIARRPSTSVQVEKFDLMICARSGSASCKSICCSHPIERETYAAFEWLSSGARASRPQMHHIKRLRRRRRRQVRRAKESLNVVNLWLRFAASGSSAKRSNKSESASVFAAVLARARPHQRAPKSVAFCRRPVANQLHPPPLNSIQLNSNQSDPIH